VEYEHILTKRHWINHSEWIRFKKPTERIQKR